MKKMNLIFGGIFLGMFLSISFIQAGKGKPKGKGKILDGPEKRKTRSVTKAEEEKPLLVLSLEDMFKDDDVTVPITSIADYINSLKGKRKEALSSAENEYQEKKGKKKELEGLVKLYEAIIKRWQDPLAFYRLGRIYERMASFEENRFLRAEKLLKAHYYFNRAFELKWRKSLLKLVRFSFLCRKLLERYLKENKSKTSPPEGMYV